MNKTVILIIVLFTLNNCSLNENSRIWKDKEKKLQTKENIKKIFKEEEKIVTEFNAELKIDLSRIVTKKKKLLIIKTI